MSDIIAQGAAIALAGPKIIKPILTPTLVTDDCGPSASSAAIAIRQANTAALSSAIAQANAIANGTGTSPSRAYRRTIVQLDAGMFALDTNTNIVITSPNVEIRGAGQWATNLMLVINNGTALFDFGTPNTAPTNLWGGTAQGYRACDLTVVNPYKLYVGAAGTRSGSVIRDWGSGGGVIERCSFMGFGYGINAVYGSDFTTSMDCTMQNCDVGAYFGPGSQQNEHRNLYCYTCNEGIVLDRVCHMLFAKPVLVGAGIAHVTIELPTTTSTRQLTSFPTSGTSTQLNVTMESPWFESNPGGLGAGTIPPQMVYVNVPSGNANAYWGLAIIRPQIMAGSISGTVVGSFLSCASPFSTMGDVLVDTPFFQGIMAYWFTHGAGGVIKDPIVAPGYTPPVVTSPTFANAVGINTITDNARLQGGISGTGLSTYPIYAKRGLYDLSAGIRETVNGNGLLQWAYATGANAWSDTIGLDATKGQIVFGANSGTPPRLGSAAAMPTTGTWSAGTFLLNSAPAISSGKVLLGWSRLTTGSGNVSGTDWTPIYGTTS